MLHRATFRRVTTVLLAALTGMVVSLSPAGAAPARFVTPPLQSWRLNGQGYATVVVGDTAYVGGAFSTAKSYNGKSKATRLDLAAFDLHTGALVQTFSADTNGTVRALATDGTSLFVGGSFTTIGGVNRTNLAAVDLTTGAVLPGWRADANKAVWALTQEAGVLYVGGAFGTLGGQSHGRIGSLDAATGAVRPWNPTATGQIRALAADPATGAVYAGGRQTAVNGQPSGYLTKLDASGAVVPVTFTLLKGYGQGLDLNSDGSRIAVAGGDNQVRYFDTTTGVEDWHFHCDGNAQAVKIIGDSVVGGYHDGCNNVAGRDLAILTLSDGDRDDTFLPTLDQFWGVYSLDGNEDMLVMAGRFTQVSGQVGSTVAFFPAP